MESIPIALDRKNPLEERAKKKIQLLSQGKLTAPD